MDPGSMDQKPAPRKMRFAPKVPKPKAPKPVVVKTEVIDDAEAAEEKELRRIYMDGLAAKPKVEKKPERVQQVAFGHASSIPLNKYNPSNGNSSQYQDKARFSNQAENKEYKEPWDYCSSYPLTLPLRRPYSGDPAVLDEGEFGKPSDWSEFDESMHNSAKELGLMEENPEPKMMLLQLPMTLPKTIRTAVANPAEEASTSSSKQTKEMKESKPPKNVEKVAGLQDLQAGCMGKMLVYKSGAVKLKLGDTLYDVTPGSDISFPQDVVAVNTQEKHFCVLGELTKRVVLTPDANSILDNFGDL